MKRGLLLLLLLQVLKLNAQNGYLLEGKIGKQSIVMVMTEDENDTSFNVRYFDKSTLKDIFLRANWKYSTKKYQLTRTEWNWEKNKEETFETFILFTNDDKKIWKGIWKNNHRETLSVNLKLIDTTKIKLSKPREYDYTEGIDRYSLLFEACSFARLFCCLRQQSKTMRLQAS